MKQTVVQFLEEKLIGHLDISERYKKELFEQAEELFEKQIEKAFQVGMFHTMNGLNPKDYYNETFKSE
jgi:hypothetical protein